MENKENYITEFHRAIKELDITKITHIILCETYKINEVSIIHGKEYNWKDYMDYEVDYEEPNKKPYYSGADYSDESNASHDDGYDMGRESGFDAGIKYFITELIKANENYNIIY